MNHQDTKTTKVGIAKTSTIGITIMIMIRIMKIQKCFFQFLGALGDLVVQNSFGGE